MIYRCFPSGSFQFAWIGKRERIWEDAQEN